MESGLLAGAQAFVGRVGSRKTAGVSRAHWWKPRVRRALTGWNRLGVPVSDKGCQRSVDFVVKALSAATTRRGSAWQASKDVLPTGARAT